MVDRVSTAFEKLTPREREILRLIAAHLQSKEIARALGLSPKTIEMHVLSARRRLSGLSRRDAALAFVAWEGGDPGNDYRRQPSALAELPDPPPSDREIGNEHERPIQIDTAVRRDPAQGPGEWRSSIEALVAGDDGEAERTGRRSGRDWRHEMSNLQWLSLLLGVAAVSAVTLAGAAFGVHQLMLVVEKITGR
jgi:DNA-binding CsgD family transcriptional regulator